MQKIGTINLTTGKVTITDPCYKKDTWCKAEVSNVHEGEWDVYIEKYNGRIAELEIRAVGQKPARFEEVNAIIGVDAGLCGIFENKPDYSDDDWSRLCDNVFFNDNYGIAFKEDFGCVGCWSSSGWGDGSYIATVGYNTEGKVVMINIDYDVYPSDDDEWSNDDDEDN